MKISTHFTTAALLLGQTGSTFIPPRPTQAKNGLPNKLLGFSQKPALNLGTPHQFRNATALGAILNYEPDDLNSYLGDDKSTEARLAFLDIMADDMTSLKKRLENGLNPDIKFLMGNTILHLIALKGTSKSLDDQKYRDILSQLAKSGANLNATNDAGSTAADFLKMTKSAVFASNLKHAQTVKIKPSFIRSNLDIQLATFSLQKQPTANAKKLIPELIKMGANIDHVTGNGKTIIENIKNNWPQPTVKAFTDMVIAAKFKCAANGQDKSLNKALINDQWLNACLEFHKDPL